MVLNEVVIFSSSTSILLPGCLRAHSPSPRVPSGLNAGLWEPSPACPQNLALPGECAVFWTESFRQLDPDINQLSQSPPTCPWSRLPVKTNIPGI